MEIPIVDVDIEPNPGSINPFRPGADRTAANRDYRVRFLLTSGDAVELNEKLNPGSMTNIPVAYRTPTSKSNARIGGAFVESGVWGKGSLLPGMLWLRYYAPDHKAGPLGGVPLPKCYMQLPSGEKFWIKHDIRLVRRRSNFPIPGVSQPGAECGPFNSRFGWSKAYGGFLQFAEAAGVGMVDNPVLSAVLGGEAGIKKRIRRMDREILGRGPDQPAPGSYEVGATYCAHIHYPSRLMSLPEGKILVITGKLPKTPKTREGQPRMPMKAEARYWSLTRYGASPTEATSMGPCYDSVMDDEIITARSGANAGWFTLVYSSPKDRPVNATPARGVTWRDWGPDRGLQSLVIRWMSVMPDCDLPEFAPNESNVPWNTGAWSSERYDQDLIGRNKPGVMGDYHPVLHLMTKAQFEALAPYPNPRDIPHTDDW
jgi:hypothetical protein